MYGSRILSSTCIIVTGFVKKGLIHTSNFSTLTRHNILMQLVVQLLILLKNVWNEL